ncbi:Disease resistance protein (CC-NBS-LRR class) family [Euphorbia peplus]|nr:Disease resistance protein (CC-NBS-LRR class) family [Euphorbia peplus]
MKNLCTLEIRQAQHLEKFTWHFPDVPGNTSFERLREVNLEKCLNLEELTWIILAQNLAILRVKSCQQIQELVSSRRMGELFEEEENLKAFTKLEILSLDGLPELESIYWRALAFQSLKRIEIISCPLLKKLPLNSSISKADEVVIEAEEEWWTNVEWEDEASKNTFLSCFRPLL